MSATAAPVYVRLDPFGGVWEHVGTRNGRATLRHVSALTDFPGHPSHGKPAEVHCSVGLLSRLTIPAAGPHAVVDAPAEASHGTAGASSPVSAGGFSPVAALPVVAAVAPSTAATPHRGARNTDPATSVEAAESITDDARRHVYDLIIRAIFEHGPQTDWQLGQRLGMLPTSCGVRRGELRDMGLVIRTEHRGPTETGPKKAWRWALTAQGAEVAA